MISDQKIYLGPQLRAFGISRGNVFYNGTHPRIKEATDLCPSVGELVVPVEQAGAVQRELAFDIARNMRGTEGKFVTFYREVQRWLDSRQNNTPNIEVKSHA
jgi:hypothetical protein